MILSGKRQGRPYLREEFSESLNGIPGREKNNVTSSGPLARN